MNVDQISEAIADAVAERLEAVQLAQSQLASALLQADDRIKKLEGELSSRQPGVTADQVDAAISKAVVNIAPVVGSTLADRITMDQVNAAVADQVSKSVFRAVNDIPPPLERDTVEKMIAKALASIPPAAPGKDGVGMKGDPGDKGEPGTKGADGVGLAGAMIDRDGCLMATLTNGEVKNLGPVVGKDGIGFESFDMEYLPESHEVAIKASAAGRTKELRFPAGGIRPGGYWRDGTKALAAQTWVHDGSMFIALKDTSEKPSTESKDWIIGARRGRDGERGVKGSDGGQPAPIKL
jgi:hypothetical protein